MMTFLARVREKTGTAKSVAQFCQQLHRMMSKGVEAMNS